MKAATIKLVLECMHLHDAQVIENDAGGFRVIWPNKWSSSWSSGELTAENLQDELATSYGTVLVYAARGCAKCEAGEPHGHVTKEGHER
jgi:hypothetical protein